MVFHVNRRTLLLMSFILAGGLFLRTVHLSERGLLVPDEAGYYSIPASAAVHARGWLDRKGKGLPPDVLREKLIEALEQANANRGVPHASKPLFGLLTILIFTLFGPSPHLLLVLRRTSCCCSTRRSARPQSESFSGWRFGLAGPERAHCCRPWPLRFPVST